MTAKYYKNVKTGIVILSGLLGTMTSCGDFLDLEPLNDIVLEEFWNSESDVNNVVARCYSAMQESALTTRMMVWGEFRSDNITAGNNTENFTDLTNVLNENITASNSFTTWTSFYNVINDCNIVIYYSPQVADNDPNYSQSELMATKAEVSAIRDLMYFYLIRTFRDVPYSTQPYLDDTQEMAIAATGFDDVLDSLIRDLESVQDYAVKTYSTDEPYYQKGRITQDAIHAMLCEMYLWKQDYASSVRYADMVIGSLTDSYQKVIDSYAGSASSSYQMFDGYPLINDKGTSAWGNAFNTIFGDGNSIESIFELVYMDDDTQLANGSVDSYYGNATNYPGYVKPADFLGTDVTDEVYTVYRDKYDTRYYENMQALSSSLFAINKYVTKTATVQNTSSTIKGSYGTVYTEDLNHSNWIIYRLTDIMLMKAEAMVELVDDPTTVTGDSLMRQALSIVNTINKRSSCATSFEDIDYDQYSSKTEMANLILQERQRELMFEGKRWYDLVRRSRRDGNTNYLVSQITRKGSGNNSAAQSKLARMDAIYWPYNLDETKVNPNLVQNTAFSSGEDNTYVKN